MDKKEITIIVKEPNKKPYINEHFIPSLKNEQELVGGHIECVGFWNKIDLWCNEEGKLMNLKSNLLFSVQNHISDIVCGTVFFASYTDDGELKSLSKAQIEQVMSLIDKYNANTILKDSTREFSIQEAVIRFDELYSLDTKKSNNNGRSK